MVQKIKNTNQELALQPTTLTFVHDKTAKKQSEDILLQNNSWIMTFTEVKAKQDESRIILMLNKYSTL